MQYRLVSMMQWSPDHPVFGFERVGVRRTGLMARKPGVFNQQPCPPPLRDPHWPARPKPTCRTLANAARGQAIAHAVAVQDAVFLAARNGQGGDGRLGVKGPTTSVADQLAVCTCAARQGPDGGILREAGRGGTRIRCMQRIKMFVGYHPARPVRVSGESRTAQWPSRELPFRGCPAPGRSSTRSIARWPEQR